MTPAKGGRESWSSGRSERPGRESVPTYERLCTSRLNLGMFVVRLYLWASERERERERRTSGYESKYQEIEIMRRNPQRNDDDDEW